MDFASNALILLPQPTMIGCVSAETNWTQLVYTQLVNSATIDVLWTVNRFSLHGPQSLLRRDLLTETVWPASGKSGCLVDNSCYWIISDASWWWFEDVVMNAVLQTVAVFAFQNTDSARFSAQNRSLTVLRRIVPFECAACIARLPSTDDPVARCISPICLSVTRLRCVNTAERYG